MSHELTVRISFSKPDDITDEELQEAVEESLDHMSEYNDQSALARTEYTVEIEDD